MTLVSSANSIGSDTEFIPRGRSYIYIHLYVMNNRGPRIDPWELHVSLYSSQRKHFEFYLVILFQLSVYCWLNRTWISFQILLKFHRNIIELTKFHDSGNQNPFQITENVSNIQFLVNRFEYIIPNWSE
jgi:hypothetical protein